MLLSGAALAPAALAEGAAAAPLPAASAVERASASMPPVGSVISSELEATDTAIELETGLVTLNLKGTLTQQVEPDPVEDPSISVRLRTTGFHVEGQSADGRYRITIEQKGIDTDPRSLLRRLEGGYQEVDVIPVTTTIDEADKPSVVLESADPVRLLADLRSFPAQGDLYQLQVPVDLVVPGNSTPAAQLVGFPSLRTSRLSQ
ncbi:hypothetical protein ACFW5I_24590 [Streptomyces sp. NPDC058818]|uniref:hypothetical protein n=1 Tax=Streptomyces sp. NPDC058818 TaxID=3346640 RepID=UPI0036B6CB1B